MLQKRLFALLCTTALTLGCILPLPVSAADDTVPAAEAGEEVRKFFEPGFDLDMYGDIDCLLTASAFPGSNMYGGIQATFSDPDIRLNIVLNHNGQYPAPTEENKLGTVPGVDGKALSVFVTEPDPDNGIPVKEYWCVADYKIPLNKTVTLDFDLVARGLQRLGLPVGRLQTLDTFCAAAGEQGVTTETPGNFSLRPEFKTESPDKLGYRYKCDEMDNGFSWGLYQNPDAGSAWIAPTQTNGFTAEWKDIPEGGRNLFDCSKQLSVSGLRLGDKDAARLDAYDVRCRYTGTLEAEGDAAVGVVAFLTKSDYTYAEAGPDTETEVQIIDAWSGKRPQFGTVCGVTEIGGVTYAISKTTVQIAFGKDTVHERTQYWIVRRENLMTAAVNTFTVETDVNSLLDVLTGYGMMTYDLMSLSAVTDVFKGSGKAVITDFDYSAEPAERQTVVKTDTTGDGYFWRLYNSNSSRVSQLRYDAEGRFTGKWENAGEVNLNCGKLFEQKLPKEIGEIRYSYAAEVKTTGTFYAGVIGKLVCPNIEFFICDVTNGEVPAYLEPAGSAEICGTEYLVFKYQTDLFYSYHSGEIEDDFTRFWFVRKDKLIQEDTSEATFEITLNISEFLKYIEDQGYVGGAVDFIAATVGATNHSSGSVSFTKNEISITEPEAPPPAKGIKDYMSPYFKIGKNMLRLDTDYEMNPLAVPDYLVNNFDIASLQYTISPEYILSGTWKPGDPIKFNFGGVDKILKECEEKQLPVVIGPLVSRHYPSAYYKDEDGSFVKPEEMNKRIEAIAKELFITLKNDYPALRLEYVLVTSEIINQYPGAATDPLVTIYGENTADLLKSAFESARKYAPAKSKLYMEEFFYPVKNSMKTVKETAAKLQKDTACIDGIAVSLTATEGTWEAESELFDEAINALAETKLDLILTDVNVFADPAYDDEGRCVTFTEAFKSFIAHASRISAVILSDHDQMLDGSHSLCTVRGLTDAIAAALPGQDISQPVQLAGDVNCDKSVDVSDAVLLARYLAEDQTANITTEGHLNADADGNTKIETDDVICILRKIAKLA